MSLESSDLWSQGAKGKAVVLESPTFFGKRNFTICIIDSQMTTNLGQIDYLIINSSLLKQENVDYLLISFNSRANQIFWFKP